MTPHAVAPSFVPNVMITKVGGDLYKPKAIMHVTHSLIHCIPHKLIFILKLICCSRAVYKLPLNRTPHVNDTIY